MKRHLAFLLAMAVLLIAALTLIVQQRVNEYHRHHVALAQEAVNSAAQAYSEFIKERQHLVQLFADENAEWLAELARNPQDAALLERLHNKVARHFPRHFAVTLTTPDGDPLIDDFDGKVGEMCVADIKGFVASRQPNPRVHPNDKAYHFDVIAHFRHVITSGILFVSFHADLLGNTLNTIQPHEHQLLLTYPSLGDLIEASSAGSRIHLPRDDFHLTSEEKARILARAEVPDSKWQVVDLHQPTLFSDFRRELLIQAAIVLLIFMLIGAVMTWSVLRAERLQREAERRKDEFLSVISHEIRTPLTSIRGSLGLLNGVMGGSLDEAARNLLDVSQRNCERLILLINDLLDVRKMEDGKLELARQPQELLPVVEQAINNTQGYAEKLGGRIELVSPLAGVRVNIDGHRIEQVLANLLSNALKYGRDAEHVEVAMSRAGQYVRVSVVDHGLGIQDDFRQRIFEKFSQADATSTRKVEGTGLGLSIVKMLVEQHGGTVGFDSRPGEGSTFYFELPVLAD